MEPFRFDEFTKALATSNSRRQALRRIGGIFAGVSLAGLFPGLAFAKNKTCAQFCASVFGDNTPAAKQCTADAAHGKGLCYSCGPAGPNLPICCSTNPDGTCTSYSSTTCCSGGLVCQNGTCIASCGQLNASCSSNSDCCTGNCSGGTCAPCGNATSDICGPESTCGPTGSCACTQGVDGNSYCIGGYGFCGNNPSCNSNSDCGAGHVCVHASCCNATLKACFPTCTG